mmetsp:Transcript_7339/g.10375  ORF Transcript_7339/g.10375 Transcript_7339/m.10375 type:complete len:120 (-) Transcript_7339:517-876(-)
MQSLSKAREVGQLLRCDRTALSRIHIHVRHSPSQPSTHSLTQSGSPRLTHLSLHPCTTPASISAVFFLLRVPVNVPESIFVTGSFLSNATTWILLRIDPPKEEMLLARCATSLPYSLSN